MAQSWGKNSSSPVGKELICFASSVPRTLGKACGFWAGDSFKGERSWHGWEVLNGILVGEMEPSQARAEGLRDALKTNAMANGAVRAEHGGLGVSRGR